MSVEVAAPGLKRLFVNRCDWVTGLRPLATLPLVDLIIDGCHHAEGFDTIASLTSLVWLSMEDTGIRDLEPVRPLSRLMVLWLRN
jgi:hypothetical protein